MDRFVLPLSSPPRVRAQIDGRGGNMGSRSTRPRACAAATLVRKKRVWLAALAVLVGADSCAHHLGHAEPDAVHLSNAP